MRCLTPLLRLLIAVLMLHSAAHAEVDTFRRQVLLPDGAPAVGAKVTARFFKKTIPQKTPNRRQARTQVDVLQEFSTLTDNRGFYEFTIELADLERRFGFLVIDAPDCALTVAPLYPLWGHRMDWGHHMDWGQPIRYEPIRLIKNYDLTGRVENEAGQPVGGVKVLYATYQLNWPASGVFTPQLITYSDADGDFTLRGVSFDDTSTNRYNLMICALQEVQEDGTKLKALWAGGVPWKPNRRLLPHPEKEPFPTQPLHIMMRPTITVQGQVIQDSGEAPPTPPQTKVIPKIIPVADAQVELDLGDFKFISISPAQTGPDGRFEFKNVPVLSVLSDTDDNKRLVGLRLTARHPQFSSVSTEVIRTWLKEPVLSQYDVCLPLRPYIKVTGRIIDIHTGKAPFYPPYFSYSRAERDSKSPYHGGGASPVVAADGSFNTRLPAGLNHMGFSGPVGFSGPGLYKLKGVVLDALKTPNGQIHRPRKVLDLQNGVVDLGSQNLTGLKLLASKDPSFCFQIDTNDTDSIRWDRYFQIETRFEINGQTYHNLVPQGLWLPAARWGEQLEVRVARGASELVPWRKVKADPKQHPIVISVGSKERFIVNVKQDEIQPFNVHEAKRKPSVRLHFQSDRELNLVDPPFLLETRTKAGDTIKAKKITSPDAHWEILPVTKWGQELEIRIIWNKREVLPWRKVEADASLRPYTISLEQHIDFTVAMGAGLPLRFPKIRR